MNDWLFFTDFNPAEYAGFIYEIECVATGRRYIGKKSFTSVRGKGRAKVVRESDWRRYWSSSADLKADIATMGKGAFVRRIIRLCTTPADLNYEETAALFAADVLRARLPDGSPAFYNRNIAGKWFPPKSPRI